MDTDVASPQYSAFISYNHRDVRHARSLQRRIERYRLPRPLRRASQFGPSGRLPPVFRDRDELTAAPDLTGAVRTALATSGHLIVVCTPNGAASHWVGQEIALFRQMRGSQAVLAALFAGSSADALHRELLTGANGEALHPLAADFRRQGDGRLALLKLVAVLAGVGLDELVRRDQQRRLRFATALSVSAAVLLAVIAGAVFFALMARAEAQAEQTRGIAAIRQLVAQREQVSRAGNVELLRSHDRAALAFFRGRDVAELPVEAQLLSATLLQGIAEADEMAGDFAGMKEAATTAWRTTDRVLAGSPDAPERILAHAQSEFWLGFACWRLDDLSASERHFIAYAVLAERLLAVEPDKPAWLKEAGDADSNLATFYLKHGDLTRAGAMFARAQQRFEAAARGPYDANIQHDLADGYGWLADVALKKGDAADALTLRTKQRAALQAMHARDPGDGRTETALIKGQLGLARALAAQGHRKEAEAELTSGRMAAEARVRRDPDNADMAAQVRAFDRFEGASLAR